MFEILQSYSIILLETICCIIFFEIFEYSMKLLGYICRLIGKYNIISPNDTFKGNT